jgi:hypothetical protein
LTLADLRAFAAGQHTGPLRLDSRDRARMQATRDIIERRIRDGSRAKTAFSGQRRLAAHYDCYRLQIAFAQAEGAFGA